MVAMSDELPAVDSGWNHQDPAESETNFKALIDRAESSGRPAYVAETLTQLARSVGLQRRFGEAHALLDRAEAMLTNDMSRARVRLLLERGRVINSSGDGVASVPLFEQALTQAQAAGLEYLAVDAAHMLGIVAQPDEAIEWNERAIEMAEAAGDDDVKGWLGPLYNNLAWTYNDIGEHEKALDLFERDIAFRNSRNLAFQASIALWSKAKTLRFLGRIDEALEILHGLVDHPDRQGNAAEGYTHEEIGECLLSLGRADEAKPHFALAFERLGGDPWLQANESARLERIRRLAD
jgi:tetratricopeptide (TPR) repeat protein